MKSALIFLTLFLAACTARTDIPIEYPTLPSPPVATPLPELKTKTDNELSKQFEEIAKDVKGKVGVAAIVLETGDAAFLNANDRFPMQSVYKLPIAMAVMDQVRLGKLDLDEKIAVTKDDMVRIGFHSPLRDYSPEGGEFKIRELIRLSLVESDGTASDVLLRIAGGPNEIQSYLTRIGIRDIKVVNSEKEISRDWGTQYENWATPTASVELLRWLDETERIILKTATPTPTPMGICNCPTIDGAHAMINDFSMIPKLMADSFPGHARLKGLLPKDTVVAHKTGTGGFKDKIYSATNDIGIIYLPNGNRLAIAVFVSDSPADEHTRESVIARIAEAAWNKWAR